MRRLIAVGVSLASLVWSGSATLHACGDKFLLIGRGIRYQRAYAAAHPATIVIYEGPRGRAKLSAGDLQLQQMLSGAGHKVRVVSDLKALELAGRVSPPDLILADDADLAQIAQTVPKGTSVVVSTAVLQSAGKTRHPLSIIDEALKTRPKRDGSNSGGGQ
jgi:hypothetical protein